MITPQEYQTLTDKASPPSPIGRNLLMAFLCGGTICAIGQALLLGYGRMGMEETVAGSLSSVTLVLLAALLTGLGIFDEIAKVAGAGTLVPITGFSNAMTAPALEFKSEGFILGLGAKMFVIAGPVICYGTVASVFCGLIMYLAKLY